MSIWHTVYHTSRLLLPAISSAHVPERPRTFLDGGTRFCVYTTGCLHGV